MNFKQANAYYRQQAGLFSEMLDPAEAVAEVAEEQYSQQVSAGSTMAIARAIRGGYAAAASAHEMLLAFANATVNVAGSQSRFRGRARAESAHADILPRLNASRARVEKWEQRAAERSVTLPTEHDGVEIALLADAELRDIYRDVGSGVIDSTSAQGLIGDVSARFKITEGELANWRRSQGFAALQ